MKVKKYKQEEHEKILHRWFKLRDFPPPLRKFLPPIGAVIYDEDGPICAGFLFRTDANAAVLGHFISDPNASGKRRHQALDILIEELVRCATAQGFEMTCCSTNLRDLMPRFEKHGFVKTDVNVSNFGRVI